MAQFQVCYLPPTAQIIYTLGECLLAVRMTAGSTDAKLSEAARNAFDDLRSLGYDVDALGRRNMNEDQIMELRDKAFKFRGIEVKNADKKMADLVSLFGLGVDLSLRSPPAEARLLAKHILYLAERQLSEL